MCQAVANGCRRWASNFFSAGFVSNSYGVAPGEAEFGQIVGTSLLGGLMGMVAGLMLAQIMRYVSFVTGRNMGGHAWTVAGAVLGAVAFAVLALTTRED
jgi:hypothetical protein